MEWAGIYHNPRSPKRSGMDLHKRKRGKRGIYLLLLRDESAPQRDPC